MKANSDRMYFRIQAKERADRGKKRKNNEDYAGWFEPRSVAELESSGYLFVVADGVGGAEKGEYASQYAVKEVIRAYYQNSQLHPVERLQRIIRRVGNEIYLYAEQETNYGKIATTLVAAVIVKNSLIVANVGDSRAYLIRDGSARQITEDHTVVGQMVREGRLTPEEATTARGKNKITRSLGGELNVAVDIFADIPLQSGDKILLCSDGLTRYASPQHIVHLTGSGSPETIVDSLIDFANQRGGADNIAALLIQVGPLESITAFHPSHAISEPIGFSREITLEERATEPFGYEPVQNPTLPSASSGSRTPVAPTMPTVLGNVERREKQERKILLLLFLAIFAFVLAVSLGILALGSALSAEKTQEPPMMETTLKTTRSTCGDGRCDPGDATQCPLDCDQQVGTSTLLSPVLSDISSTVATSSTETPTIEQSKDVAKEKEICVVHAVKEEYLGIAQYLSDFGLEYDPDYPYERCKVNDVRTICEQREELLRNTGASGTDPNFNHGDWLIMPDVDEQNCVSNEGRWIVDRSEE